MAAAPITEAIALTEKKMDMTLDDIINMSKAKPTKPKKQRVSNRNQKFINKSVQDRNMKVRKFMDTRSSLRQGALSQKRSKFQDNQFPLASDAAKKAAMAPIRNRAFGKSKPFNTNKPRNGARVTQKNIGSFTVKKEVGPSAYHSEGAKPKTLDSLFANMKEQRMRAFSSQPQPNGGGGGPRINGPNNQRGGAPWTRNRARN